jgi:hypothetical protein
VAQGGCEPGGHLDGKLQRTQPVGALAVESQRLLTGREDAGAGHGAQQCFRLPRRRRDEMLAIVEHEQQLPPAQGGREPLRGPASRAALQAERRVDGARRQVRIGEGRELREPDAIGKFLEHGPRRLEPEARLADAAGPHERDQPVVAQQLAHFPQLGLAADEIRHRRRQVGRDVPRRRRRAGRGRQCAPLGIERPHLAREAVAAQRHGENEAAILAERLAQGGDLHLDVAFLDHGAGPDAREQLLLGDELALGLDQNEQHVERPGAERNGRITEAQLPLPGQESKSSELEASGASRSTVHE